MTSRALLAGFAAVSILAADTAVAEVSSAFAPFKARREALLDSLGNGIAVLYSKAEEVETGYRSDTDFYYLTGLEEKDAILVLVPGAEEQEILLEL